MGVIGKEILVFKEDGQMKVKIADYGFGLELNTMRNGFQWSGQQVNEKMLRMIRDAINEYFEKGEE